MATVFFPMAFSFLSINILYSRSSKMGLCFLRFKPQKLTRAVWFSSPYSTSFSIKSLTMYILSLYEVGEPDISFYYSLFLLVKFAIIDTTHITCGKKYGVSYILIYPQYPFIISLFWYISSQVNN